MKPWKGWAIYRGNINSKAGIFWGFGSDGVKHWHQDKEGKETECDCTEGGDCDCFEEPNK